MDAVIANALEIIGSHGMRAHRYDAMLAMILSGQLQPEKLLGKTISLTEPIDVLTGLDKTIRLASL